MEAAAGTGAEAGGAVRIAVADDVGLRPLVAALCGPDGAAGAAGKASVSCDGMRLLTVDAWDVPALVERAVVDGGVVARHILAEAGARVVQLLDLGLTPARLVLVMPASRQRLPAARRPVVVTTHPRSTRRYFESRGLQVEVMALRTAPDALAASGDADAAVVALGDHEAPADGLVIGDVLCAGTARFVVGPSARLLRAGEMGAVIEKVQAALHGLGERKAADAAP